MQTPYQPLVAPQVVYHASVSSPSTACCPCCVEPACCSRVGTCPCFCTGSTVAFSMALSAVWLALPMLITAAAVTDLFEVSLYGNPVLFLGMWQACVWSDAQLNCQSYGNDVLNDAFDGAAAQFNAVRALTLVGGTFTLVAGILGAIRLARQQRSKPNSNALNYTTLLSVLLALGSTGAAFGITFPLISALDTVTYRESMGMTSTTWGLSWLFMIIGLGLLAKGALIHLIAHCCYQRKVANEARQEGEQPALSTAGYPAASIFAHPQPLHVAPLPPAYYPTATAIHYPPPHYVHQPPMNLIYQ